MPSPMPSPISGLKSYFGSTINISGETTASALFSARSTVESCFLRLIDDALLALSRIHPRRLIAPSGSVVLQNIVPFTTLMTEERFDEFRTKCGGVYECTCAYVPVSKKGDKRFAIATMIPTFHCLDYNIFSIVHDTQGKSFEATTINDILDAKSLSIPEDPYFAGCTNLSTNRVYQLIQRC
ncbi:hypothetical protein CONCODRAFT_7990 [Conidiobolus coronatus NRRL 28638]|uniref:Uncharacterized protein n=1 Tax=Conidiobolus coronatus (strain ATCC 28846 / CBS 209.66 / NRRL 28638) TaxID=796925 RepID=A0A137P3H4_CONC2|nr:hypothetical protein CONCODRAFT_7990 [Conidiobolus coronatus NRRL 28638]|eukprot:KXN69577.1 hypothetical protein CONCODRAFT_7990 [Conidiobolus coronatus NRRL 28638]